MANTSPPASALQDHAEITDATRPTLWFQIFNEIGIINQLSTTQLERTLPTGLKFADFRVLNHFMRLGGPRTPLALANSFQVTKGTMTHTLQKLDRLGLITIAAHAKDGRSKLVDITDAGRTAHAQSLAGLLPSMEGVVQGLDPTVETALRDALPALSALREALDKARD
ncbi:MAG: MarR family winged helix-turn-helix transcriptional regulator [Devosiaceae bacterium]